MTLGKRRTWGRAALPSPSCILDEMMTCWKAREEEGWGQVAIMVSKARAENEKDEEQKEQKKGRESRRRSRGRKRKRIKLTLLSRTGSNVSRPIDFSERMELAEGS